jgi:hypothetical protein
MILPCMPAAHIHVLAGCVCSAFWNRIGGPLLVRVSDLIFSCRACPCTCHPSVILRIVLASNSKMWKIEEFERVGIVSPRGIKFGLAPSLQFSGR